MTSSAFSLSNTSDDKQVVISDTLTDRYATLNLISWWRQDVVRDATVMVVGAGALGNEVIKNLALLGIGKLMIVDFDTIEDANLSRSVLFRQSDRGRRKAEVAAERARKLNPDVHVLALCADINDIGLGVFRRMDAVVGCLDNRQGRLAINRACYHVGKPWIDGAIEALQGIARVFWPNRGACYECTLTQIDWQVLNQRYSCPWLAHKDIQQGRVPTTPTMASVIGGIQVQEVLKVLHEMPVAAGFGLYFDGRTNEALLTEYKEKTDCQSHWQYDAVTEVPQMMAKITTVRDLLAHVRAHIGDDAYVELDEDLVIMRCCSACGSRDTVLVPIHRISDSTNACPRCGSTVTFETTHQLTDSELLAHCTLASLGIPPLHILAARNGERYHYFELTGDQTELLNF